MAKHRFYVPGVAADGLIAMDPAQARQVATVLRLKPGDRVRVFDGNSALDQVVELTLVQSGRVEGLVVGTAANASEPLLPLWVYPALLPRDNFERALQKLTEVGASGIVPVITRRTLARKAPEEAQWRRWQHILVEAAEQSGRGYLPRLEPCAELDDALRAAWSVGPVLLADLAPSVPRLRDIIAQVPGDARRVSLFVGPEGGFAPEEIASAEAAGARLFTLGPQVMRAETASPVLAALLLEALEPG